MAEDKISYRIMRTGTWRGKQYNVVVYHIACDCSAAEHTQAMEIELDTEFNMCFIRFWADLEWSLCWCDSSQWGKRLWYRIKGAARILFLGRVKMQKGFIIRGREHLEALEQAIEEGKRILVSEENTND